jgi:hypothetical protein
MAKHDTDPVLEQLVRAVNESGQARVPVTVSAHGTVLSVEAVDGWAVGASAAAADDDKGPFARLLRA